MLNKIYVGDNLNIFNSDKLDPLINKVDMVYIDPPYNNGSNFSYNNSQDSENWCDYLSKRIFSSYKYMSETSAIFVSIDDKEFANLKHILDKIFGNGNFVGTFITRQSQRSNAKHINTVHEYVLCYAKNKKKLSEFKIDRVNIPEDKTLIDKLYYEVSCEFNKNGHISAYKLLQKLIKNYCLSYNITWLRNYNNIDENGKIYFAKDLSTPSKPKAVDIPAIKLHLAPLSTRGWSSDKKFIDLYNKGRLVFKGDRPYEKHYLEESQDSAPSILNFYSRQGTNALKKLGIYKLFDTPKPVEMIKFFIRLCCKKDSIILDYFAGSGTTAQATYEVNREDNTNHKYVLIQLNEDINKKTEVFEECVKLNIKPKMQYVLKYRIDKYLDSIDKQIDYEFYDE